MCSSESALLAEQKDLLALSRNFWWMMELGEVYLQEISIDGTQIEITLGNKGILYEETTLIKFTKRNNVKLMEQFTPHTKKFKVILEEV
jgi:hypothetical protein